MKTKYIVLSIITFFSIVSVALYGSGNQTRVVFCTFYTPSHAHMAEEWLLPSLKDIFDEISIGTAQQDGHSATFLKEGWTTTTRNKVAFIIDTIKKNMGSIIIFADADIFLFCPIKDEIMQLLESHDFVIQIDKPGTACSGFFALYAQGKTLKLWEKTLSIMEHDHTVSDQKALNRVLKKNKISLSWTFLPTTYFGGGTFGKGYWRPGKKLIIPQNPRMFHANYTRYAHKVAMLTYVKMFYLKELKGEKNGY